MQKINFLKKISVVFQKNFEGVQILFLFYSHGFLLVVNFNNITVILEL